MASIGSQTESPSSFALRQYTKAVGILSSVLSNNQPSFEAVLMSCLLFVWIEFVQNNFDTAFHHLQSGLQILKDLRQASRLAEINPSLPRLFKSLYIQARFHGSPSSPFNTYFPEQKQEGTASIFPATFSSISEARGSLDQLIGALYEFFRQMYNPSFVQYRTINHPYPDPLSLEAIRQLHLSNFQAWHCTLTNSQFQPQQESFPGVQVLLLQYTSNMIMLHTLLATSVMVFDSLTPEFNQILSLSSNLIQSQQTSVDLSFDPFGVIQPLLHLTLKCRQPLLRRQAIALLHQAPAREGIWRRDAILQYAEWKVQREERGYEALLADGGVLPAEARIHSEQGSEVVVKGRKVTMLRYKTGEVDRAGLRDFEEEEIVGLVSGAVGEVI